jgi:hypothetical protein
MADIALGVEISREFLPGFLQKINSHGTKVASHSASGTQPHKFNDAAGHTRSIVTRPWIATQLHALN